MSREEEQAHQTDTVLEAGHLRPHTRSQDPGDGEMLDVKDKTEFAQLSWGREKYPAGKGRTTTSCRTSLLLTATCSGWFTNTIRANATIK